jgi:hypothetical protein
MLLVERPDEDSDSRGLSSSAMPLTVAAAMAL